MTLELCLVISFIALLLSIFSLSLWKVQSRQIKQLLEEVTLQTKTLAIYQDAGQGLGNRLSDTERQLHDFVRSQSMGDDEASQQAKYLKATELLAAGGDIPSIAESCDMTESEVKLLQLMQRKNN